VKAVVIKKRRLERKRSTQIVCRKSFQYQEIPGNLLVLK
jgi:hypothetical protein